jgi:hypothetical protein
MNAIVRASILAGAFLPVVAAEAAAQSTGSLKVTIVLYTPSGRVGTTVVKHTLIITKQGAPATRLRVPTRLDGTIDLQLDPGTYVLESERGYPFARYYHRWTRTVAITAGETTTVELTNSNAAREIIPLAASAPQPLPSTPEDVGPILVFQLKSGAPLRAAAGGSVLLPIGKMSNEDGFTGARGVEAGASAGAGGWRVEGGVFAAALPFRVNALGTFAKTSSAPRGATPHATYVGFETGAVVIPFGVVVLRPSIGVMHRVSGPSGPKRTAFTWSVDLQVLIMR